MHTIEEALILKDRMEVLDNSIREVRHKDELLELRVQLNSLYKDVLESRIMLSSIEFSDMIISFNRLFSLYNSTLRSVILKSSFYISSIRNHS